MVRTGGGPGLVATGAVLLLLLSGLAGCSEATPTGPQDPLLGVWTLVAVNGEPLPLVPPWDQAVELREAQVDFSDDGSVTWSQRVCAPDGEDCEWSHLQFAWEQDGEFVHILFEEDEHGVGSAEWAVFRLVDGELRGPRIDGIHLLFHRP